MKRFALLLGFLIFIGAQIVSADSLVFREVKTHKCTTSICGEYKGGTVETGTVSKNGRRVGTYRQYTSKDGEKTELDLNIRDIGER